MGGKKPFALADEEPRVRELVAEKPDITGSELLGRHGHLYTRELCAWLRRRPE